MHTIIENFLIITGVGLAIGTISAVYLLHKEGPRTSSTLNAILFNGMDQPEAQRYMIATAALCSFVCALCMAFVLAEHGYLAGGLIASAGMSIPCVIASCMMGTVILPKIYATDAWRSRAQPIPAITPLVHRKR